MTIAMVNMTIVAIIISYFIGSLSSAILLCKLLGLPDPRQQGSGNPGATNVLRFGGKKVAFAVLVGDMLKGALPVYIFSFFLAPFAVGLCALAAFLGHLFPLYFGFKGGKGVATALGTWFALDWRLGLLAGGIWLVVAFMTRYSSLAAVMMTLVVLAAPFIFDTTMGVFIMCLLLLWTHRNNILRLYKGTEPKIGT